MRLSKRRQPTPLSMCMTPMIDIVFLLIIFFMTLPQLTRIVYHPIELPIVQKIDPDKATEQMTINVDQDGEIVIAGKPYSQSETENQLEQLIRKHNNNPDRILILLRADGRVQTDVVNQLVDMFNSKNIKQVRVSARSQK